MMSDLTVNPDQVVFAPLNGDTMPLPITSKTASWRLMVAPYLKPDGCRALIQLVTTGLSFLGVTAGMLVALSHENLIRDSVGSHWGGLAGEVVHVSARLRTWFVLCVTLGK